MWLCFHLCHGSFMTLAYRKEIYGSSLCYAAGALPVKLGQSPKLVPFLAQETHSSFSVELRFRFTFQRVPGRICLLSFSYYTIAAEPILNSVEMCGKNATSILVSEQNDS